MDNDNGNYAAHARFWDWSGPGGDEEKEYWLEYAAKYGKNVLIPMCAWGETGAYLAEHGCTVTAFDLAPEMIAEGRKHFGHVPGLTLLEGDVTNFQFDIPPVDFCFSMDFEVLHSLEDLKRALRCIHSHLRVGGCLVIKPYGLPEKSHTWPEQTYLPRNQKYTDKKVWKTGHGHDDAKTRRRYISQTLHVEYADGRMESFEHAFYSQCYTRKEWLAALKECGFDAAYIPGRKLDTWYGGGDTIEAVKV